MLAYVWRGRATQEQVPHYPQGTIKSAKGIYHLDEQLAFVAVQTNEQRDHAYWSELTLFASEEIRFLSALLLSPRPDYGVLRLYPFRRARDRGAPIHQCSVNQTGGRRLRDFGVAETEQFEHGVGHLRKRMADRG
jgi:hypothetical protein